MVSLPCTLYHSHVGLGVHMLHLHVSLSHCWSASIVLSLAYPSSIPVLCPAYYYLFTWLPVHAYRGSSQLLTNPAALALPGIASFATLEWTFLSSSGSALLSSSTTKVILVPGDCFTTMLILSNTTPVVHSCTYLLSCLHLWFTSACLNATICHFLWRAPFQNAPLISSSVSLL